jgi:pimeloyl-ACP methyl ester carboxylesterase
MVVPREGTERDPGLPTLLLVHGAWHGAWVWTRLLPELVARGCEVHTMDLPSVAQRGTPQRGLYDDAAAFRTRIDEIEGPVAVVAHSYGGAVVTQGASDLANVCHIVYVCAFALDVGESINSFTGYDSRVVDGAIMPMDDPVSTFYGDVDPQGARWAAAQLEPISYGSFIEPVTSTAWQSISSTYIVCDFDEAIKPPAQRRMAKRASTIRRLAASHSPMLSMPSELADLIVEAARMRCPSP